MLNNSAKNVTANSAYADQSEDHRGQHQCQESDRDSKLRKICYQCQQQSHFASDCYFKTDKDGKELLFNENFKSSLKSKTSSNKVTEKLNSLKNSEGSNSKQDISKNSKNSKT